MAVKMRLKRFGRKKSPTYRLVVAESSTPRDGYVLDEIGVYNPVKQPTLFEFNKERVEYWLSVGAQTTETVERLLGQEGIIEVKPKLVKSKPVKKEKAQESNDSENKEKSEGDS